MDTTGRYPVLVRGDAAAGTGDYMHEISDYTAALAAAIQTGRHVPRPLGTADLNTVTASGVYYQPANANATTARRYPVAWAGLLEVHQNLSMTYQRYTTYQTQNRVYVRGQYQGTWGPWKIA